MDVLTACFESVFSRIMCAEIFIMIGAGWYFDGDGNSYNKKIGLMAIAFPIIALMTKIEMYLYDILKIME